MCACSDVAVVSVDHRHGSLERFPAAAEDASAALQWVAAHAIEFGAVCAQRARDDGQVAAGALPCSSPR